MNNSKLYFRAHRHAYEEAIHYLKAGWLGSVFTLLVIAIALALPWGLLLLSRYANTLFDDWNHHAQIELYLRSDLSLKTILDLKTKLESNPNIISANYISPEEGLMQLERREGFKDVISQLDQNPLPPVLELELNPALAPQNIDDLANELRQLPLVDQDHVNIGSVKQLYSVLQTGKRFIFGLSLLLGAAVTLVIGNTLRLIILQREEEIQVMKLIGASMSYTRRPYLYIGLMLGVVGGLLAWLLTYAFLSYLNTPLQSLSGITQGFSISLHASLMDSLLFLTLCGLLGWGGALLATQRHLS